MRSAAGMRWIGGAVFLSVVIAAIAWFLLISPVQDATSDARERAESEQVRIDQLEIQLAGLRADFARLDEFKAELEEIQSQIPTEVLLNELVRQIDGVATQTEVFVLGVEPGLPYEVETASAPAPPPSDDLESEDETSDDAAAEGSPAPAAQPTGPVLPAGFYAVPVQVTLLGAYDETIEFVENLQRENPRIVLVRSMSAVVQDEQGAQAGRPDTEAGDLETMLGLLVWVLVDEDGNVEIPPDDEQSLPELPAGNGNPFAPLQ